MGHLVELDTLLPCHPTRWPTGHTAAGSRIYGTRRSRVEPMKLGKPHHASPSPGGEGERATDLMLVGSAKRKRRTSPLRPFPVTPEPPRARAEIDEFNCAAEDSPADAAPPLRDGRDHRHPHHDDIERETPLVPRAAAMRVWEEASVWLDAELPRHWVIALAERAEIISAHNPRVHRLLRRRGDAGRDWLLTFMRHWLSALLEAYRPLLSDRLPADYRVGHPLPPR